MEIQSPKKCNAMAQLWTEKTVNLFGHIQWTWVKSIFSKGHTQANLKRIK